MNRRQLLLTGGIATAALVAGVTLRHGAPATAGIASLIAELEALRGQRLSAREGWPPFKVLSHLAQSIELSMTAYPELKSAAFRHTVGPAAFFAFSTAGAMRHPLTEAIPGAPVIAESGDVVAAQDRLLQALHTFLAYEGNLAPHFAYGELSKAEYAQAHVMHVRDHWRVFEVA